MMIKNLGYRTEFMFNRFDGSVEERDGYVVARTASNPHYFWGNLLYFPNAPKEGDFEKWCALSEKEFDPKIYRHQTFAWDSIDGESGKIDEFSSHDFKFEHSVVLTTDEVKEPPKYNPNVEVAPIISEDDFEESIRMQVATGGDYLSKEAWEDFSRKSLAKYRQMIAAGRGYWFGARLDGKLAGSLGIFMEGNVARYQVVTTSPEFQRRGVCSSLVYKSALHALREMGAKQLVMVADEDYHAAKIYESVGFKPTQKQVGLCWWDKKFHS